MKKGLVLEGGAMRGLFTSGIIDVMMEAGIEPDGLIGVSAGAAFGCDSQDEPSATTRGLPETSATAVGSHGGRPVISIMQSSVIISYRPSSISLTTKPLKRTRWSSMLFAQM